ncbi:hypothetical protein MMC21_006675 [Puttea exsequens]|nr:hypothetical protein [Puttea exsequens]
MSYSTYAGTINQYRDDYYQQLDRHEVWPFVIPTGLFNYILLIAYMVLGTKPSRLITKISVFLAILASSTISIRMDRTVGLVYGVLIGISSSLCVTLSFTLLFVHDPAEDFERMVAVNQNRKRDDCPERDVENGTWWQQVPNTIIERLYWTLDLVWSLRALHWSRGSSPGRKIKHTNKECSKEFTSLRRSFGKLLLIYLSVDVLKEIIASDPYFWGNIDSQPPEYIRFLLQTASLVQIYRMTVAFAVLYVSIQFISVSGVFIFVNILGPSSAGTWGNDWANRPLLGSLGSI